MRILYFVLTVVTLPLRPFFWLACRCAAKPCPQCGEKWFTTLTGEWGEEDWKCVCGHTWSVPYGSKIPVTPPPIGVAPKWLWDEQFPTPTANDLGERLVRVEAAINRYREAGRPVSEEWRQEAAEIRGKLILSDFDLEQVSAGKSPLQDRALANRLAVKAAWVGHRYRTPAQVASDATPKGTCGGGTCR